MFKIRKILVISPTPSHPQNAGNRARIFSLLSYLKTCGYEICFVFVGRETGDEDGMASEWDYYYSVKYKRPGRHVVKRIYDKVSRLLGLRQRYPYCIDDWYDFRIDSDLVRIRNEVKPDIVLVEYVYMSAAFKHFGANVLKILDTHDVLGDRHKVLLKKGMTPYWFYTTRREEKKGVDRSDVVVAIQDSEGAYFKSLTNKNVIVVPHIPVVKENAKIKNNPKRILFVGSNNDPNVDGLRWFIREVLPELQKVMSDVEVEIVGNVVDKVNIPMKGVIMTGVVDDLSEHYGQASVVINPVRVGTGLKIKTIEALAYGRPLVATSHSAIGLEKYKNVSYLIADSVDEFIYQITSVMTSEKLASDLSVKSKIVFDEYMGSIEKSIDEMIWR